MFEDFLLDRAPAVARAGAFDSGESLGMPSDVGYWIEGDGCFIDSRISFPAEDDDLRAQDGQTAPRVCAVRAVPRSSNASGGLLAFSIAT